MLLSLGYSESSSSDDDDDDDEVGSNKTIIDVGDTSKDTTIEDKEERASKNVVGGNLSEKFKQLKGRRLEIAEASKKDEDSHSTKHVVKNKMIETKTTESEKKRRRNRKETKNYVYEDLNQYMPDAFEVKDRHDLYKKTKIEKEIDDAIKEKDYKLAESLNEEIYKRTFATQVKSAFEARNYTITQNEKERLKKKKKREKLKWAFDQKQRWESKGNM